MNLSLFIHHRLCGLLSLVHTCVRIEDFLFLTYVNECLIDQSMQRILNCFCKDVAFIQSHWPEEAISDSYNNCEPGFRLIILRIIM